MPNIKMNPILQQKLSKEPKVLHFEMARNLQFWLNFSNEEAALSLLKEQKKRVKSLIQGAKGVTSEGVVYFFAARKKIRFDKSRKLFFCNGRAAIPLIAQGKKQYADVKLSDNEAWVTSMDFSPTNDWQIHLQSNCGREKRIDVHELLMNLPYWRTEATEITYVGDTLKGAMQRPFSKQHQGKLETLLHRPWNEWDFMCLINKYRQNVVSMQPSSNTLIFQTGWSSMDLEKERDMLSILEAAHINYFQGVGHSENGIKKAGDRLRKLLLKYKEKENLQRVSFFFEQDSVCDYYKLKSMKVPASFAHHVEYSVADGELKEKLLDPSLGEAFPKAFTDRFD